MMNCLKPLNIGTSWKSYWPLASSYWLKAVEAIVNINDKTKPKDLRHRGTEEAEGLRDW
jgi:hypothetical protein